MNQRSNFTSKIGFVLAAAGSAVGLGNIWRFPYETGSHGGAAFILVYLACVFLLGLPIMIAEFTVGRHAKASCGRAFGLLAPGTLWKWIGPLGVLSGLLILGYYSVVAGWTLEYVLVSLTNGFAGQTPDDFVATFQAFSQHPFRPLVWMLVFLLLTHYIVIKGVKDGIEKSSKLMMPILFILILVLAGCSLSLPNAQAGLEFLLKPDFSKVDAGVFLGAMGQAFFSLSLGMGCLATYASYFSSETHLGKTALSVGVIDTLVAILAGLIIFPAAFSVGIQPDAGPSLIFITLPNVFQQAFGAVPFLSVIFSLMFYVLLALAALTSTISMHEIGTAFFYEELHITRRKGAWIETTACVAIGIVCALSVGAVEGLGLFGKSVMDCCDYLTSNILMPLGSFATCIFLGWYVPRKVLYNEITNWGTLRGRLFGVWLFAIRFVCPLCILIIFLHQMGVF